VVAEVTCVLDAQADLGECPVWSAPEQALYWVDIYAPALYRLDPATGRSTGWPMPSPIGSFGLCDTVGTAVVALVDGFHRVDLGSGDLQFLAGPGPVPGVRFNDGKVSPDGRFFAGTMDSETESRPVGALHRLDPDHTVHRVADGLVVSNGLAWSPDGRTMYHSDSARDVIWAYEYDPDTGTPSAPRVLARPDAAVGLPDGAAVDDQGYYWSAGVSAGVLNRWAPDGRLDRTIPLPCTSPTAPCFGGPDLRTIFVTSLRRGVSAPELAARPLSGGIFAVEVDVPGVPVGRYRG
jgi:sugar lactone lactonase YvrE